MLLIDFQPFPVIETERLFLRKPSLDDVSDIFEFRSHPEVMKYIPRPLAKSHDDVEALLLLMQSFLDKNEKINWAIQLKETGKVLGLIGFVDFKPEHYRAEVGYSLNADWQRQGYTTEALIAVLHYGFYTMKCHTIEAITDADNVPSQNLLRKVGFREEARFVEDFYANGEFRNSTHFGIMQSEVKH